MSHPHLRFAAIGECMIELKPQQERYFAMGFAGDTYNTSLYMARYNNEINLEVHYVTALGTDPYSDMMMREWNEENIATQLVLRVEDSLPGVYIIHTDNKGERKFYYYRSQSAARQLFYQPLIKSIEEQLLNFNYIYLSGISLAILDTFSRQQLITLLTSARKAGCKICIDGNYRPRLWENSSVAKSIMQQAYAVCDIALCTFDDEQQLFGDSSPEKTAVRLHGYGINEVVVKLGKKGCYISSVKGQEWVKGELVQKVVDTTAAGDSFNAAYLCARIKDLSPGLAAQCGNKLAAKVITYPGAIMPKEAMPKLFME